MLAALIRFSIRHAALVLVLAALLLGVAAWRLPRTAVDVFPELDTPTVVVMTEAPGLSAEEIERRVTRRVEAAVHGSPGVRRVRSSSAIGLSIVYVDFDGSADVYRARQFVDERLEIVRDELPDGAHAVMTPIASITGEIMLLAVASPEGVVSPSELRAFAEVELRPRLLTVPGVAEVSVMGGALSELRVEVSTDVLTLHDLSIDDVARAVREAHADVAIGYFPSVAQRELPTRQTGGARAPDDVASVILRTGPGAPLTVGDVAHVRYEAAPRRGTGSSGGSPAVVLTVQKTPTTNTLDVTSRIDAMLDALEPLVPVGAAIERSVFRQADFIELAVGNVGKALRDAAIVVALILMLFLLDLRTTLATLVALPLSLASGVLVLETLGETLNVMTLGGLAIAVGSLVDDAIIDVENVFRRLRQEAERPEAERRSRLAVILDASNEIRPAMVFATAIIALVFVPLLFLEGIEGRFFRPLGIAFVVSILASLLVALTVTPAMCRVLLRMPRSGSAAREAPLVRWLRGAYAPVLDRALAHRRWVLAGAALATVASLFVAATFGRSFLPDFNEGTFTVGLYAPPGTSLDASDRMAAAVERRLVAIDGVRSVTRRTGRAERDEHAEPVSNSEIDVTLVPGARKEVVREAIDDVLAAVPGIAANVGQPIAHRLSHILSGTPAALAVDIHGEDLDRLRAAAGEIERALRSLPGARDVSAHRELRARSLVVAPDRGLLAVHGLTPLAAAHAVRAALHGVHVAELFDGARRHDLVVRTGLSERADPEALGDLVLVGAGGARVRLRDVAELRPELAPALITREGGERKAVVALDVAAGHNLGDLVGSVRRVVDPLAARHGLRVSYGGQWQAQVAASRTILIGSAAVLVLLIVLLHIAVGSLPVALVVLANLPLALIGGIVAVFVAGSPDLLANVAGLFGAGPYTAPVLSIASLVGFVTLFGIAIRGGILLVNHYRRLVEHERCTPAEAVRRGSEERLIPILMTALTAALALVPLVLHAKAPGNEILSPLAAVILGGLFTSTFLNLVVVPAGYAALHRIPQAPPTR